MNNLGFDLNKGLASLQGHVSELSSSFTPFAKRTKQLINERLGNSDEVTTLPEEYLELERRVDALKAVHTKILAITTVYEHDGYDYPPNLRESLTDLSRTVQSRVTEAASAQSASDLGSILVGGGKDATKREPKTLNHAFGRALGQAHDELGTAGQPPLSKALGELSQAELAIGDAHVEQDAQISRINASFHTTLATSISFAAKARKNVLNARLNLDSAKGSLKSAGPEHQADAQTDVEKAEDEFVAAIEDAVTVMKNVLENPEPVTGLAKIAQAQLSFYKAAADSLAKVAPELEKLQDQQEASYRESREAA